MEKLTHLSINGSKRVNLVVRGRQEHNSKQPIYLSHLFLIHNLCYSLQSYRFFSIHTLIEKKAWSDLNQALRSGLSLEAKKPGLGLCLLGLDLVGLGLVGFGLGLRKYGLQSQGLSRSESQLPEYKMQMIKEMIKKMNQEMIEKQTLFNSHLELFYNFLQIYHYKSFGFSNLNLVNSASALWVLASASWVMASALWGCGLVNITGPNAFLLKLGTKNLEPHFPYKFQVNFKPHLRFCKRPEEGVVKACPSVVSEDQCCRVTPLY